MAFANVQSAQLLGQTAGATTVAVSLTNVVAGNLICITVHVEGATSTITVSDGTTSFTEAIIHNHSNGDMSGAQFFLLSSVANGSVTYTATFGASRAYRGIVVSEHSYSGTVSLDVKGTANEQAVTAVVTSSITTTGTDELIVGSCVAYSSETYSSPLIGAVAADGSASGGSNTSMAQWWRILTGTITGIGAITKSSTAVSASMIMSFKAVAAAGSILPQMMQHHN